MIRRLVLAVSAVALAVGVTSLWGASQAVERPPLAAHNDTSTPFNVVSLPALMEHHYDGRDLRVGPVLASDDAGTRYLISYRSGDLTISGLMGVPSGPGPFPVLVLAHGWAAPDDYTNGAGLAREQEAFAAAGYVVVHTDYRNFASSSREGAAMVDRPLGYPEDLINAVVALRQADLPFTDLSRVGVYGRSMGGGVALEALEATPGLFDAAVLSSPVSSLAADNLRRWVAPGSALAEKVQDAYQTPATRPRFWAQASPRTYLDRIQVPVQIHHGTADPVCPVRWSRATAAAMRRAGDSVQLFEYPGELHRFTSEWSLMSRRAIAFFDAELG